jgi:hypothetical protein
MFKLNRSFFWFSQLKKDFLVDYSYKITFFSQFFGIFLTAASFFFISEIFVNTKSDHLKAFNYDYFIFATIGIAILDIVITIMRSLTQSLREAQSFGYVEILFISKIKPGYIFLCAAIYPFLKGVIKFILSPFNSNIEQSFFSIFVNYDFVLFIFSYANSISSIIIFVSIFCFVF